MVIFIYKQYPPMSVKKGKIYKITNKINGKVYIGCTIYSLEKRFYEHMYRCFNTDHKSKLYNSIRKYGKENFKIELIEECDLKIIYSTEKKYIKEYDSYKNGMNSTLGGEGCLGYVHTPEIREKISKILKDGKSHKGKSYEIIYGKNSEIEKEKRKKTVKLGWDLMSEEEKKNRVNNMRETLQKNSKYGVDFIKEIKTKIKEGLKINEFKQQYPQLRIGIYYELKNGKRWSNI